MGEKIIPKVLALEAACSTASRTGRAVGRSARARSNRALRASAPAGPCVRPGTSNLSIGTSACIDPARHTGRA